METLMLTWLLLAASSCLGGAGGGTPSSPLQIYVSPTPVPPATVGQSYLVKLFARKTPSLYRDQEWIITGSVPPGLTVCEGDRGYDGSECVISGLPTTPGEFKMNVTVIGITDGRVMERATLHGGLTIVVVAP